MILLIDNYDSFTWNIYQYLCELGAKVIVQRNDKLTLDSIANLNPKKIVISPGPSTPDKSGISLNVIKYYAGKIPIFGVCLGHQAIAQAFGAKIIRAKKIMHGKKSIITHNGIGVFNGINSPMTVIRYNSLIINKSTLPSCFNISAFSENKEIMGIIHNSLDLEGVQFHPESIMSEYGHQLFANFVHR